MSGGGGGGGREVTEMNFNNSFLFCMYMHIYVPTINIFQFRIINMLFIIKNKLPDNHRFKQESISIHCKCCIETKP